MYRISSLFLESPGDKHVGVLAHIIQTLGHLPPQLRRSPINIRHKFRDISKPPLGKPIIQRFPHGFLKALDNIHDTKPTPGSQIEDIIILPHLTEFIQSHHMSIRQISDVNVIPHASTIRRGIVITENVQCWTLTHNHLLDEREEVVGVLERLVTQLVSLMSTAGVEVAKTNDSPIRMHLGQ